MEVRRQIMLCYIVGCCVNIIYTKDLDGNNSLTTLTSEESTDMTGLKTGNLRGNMTVRKYGDKLKFKINSNVFWNVNKSMESETCTEAVNLKGEKGDKGADAIQASKGEKGKIGDKGASGQPGIKGTKGESGSNGTNGSNGAQGEPGDCTIITPEDIKKKTDYGKSNNPAYSCNEFKENGIYHLNRANSFNVSCEDHKSCVGPKVSQFEKIRKNEKAWLSSYKLDFFFNFYSLRISELSYLMTTTESFRLSLTYSSELKILEILCWNGITVKISSNIHSHGCQGSTNEEGTELHLECTPANYLPMDFLIEAKTEKVAFELKKLCFT